MVVTLLPCALLGGELEPLTRALAARSRFPLERFSDVYLVARAIAADVQSAASSGRISFALGAAEQVSAEVTELADELAAEPVDTLELLRVVSSPSTAAT